MDTPKLGDINQQQKKLYQVSIFIGKLLLAGLIFRAILYLEPSTVSLQKSLAQLTSSLLNLLGHTASFEGITIFVEQNAYTITQDCLGWKSVAAFLGLSFASGQLRKKSKLVALGILGILLANLARIITTIILSQSGWVSFEFIHGFMWRWLLTAVVLATWIGIMKSERISDFLRTR